MTLFVVNQTREPQKRVLDFDLPAGAHLQPDAAVWTLADTAKAPERDAANSWSDPERIHTQAGKAAMAGSKLDYEFTALSLTVIEVHQ